MHQRLCFSISKDIDDESEQTLALCWGPSPGRSAILADVTFMSPLPRGGCCRNFCLGWLDICSCSVGDGAKERERRWPWALRGSIAPRRLCWQASVAMSPPPWARVMEEHCCSNVEATSITRPSTAGNRRGSRKPYCGWTVLRVSCLIVPAW